MIDAEEVRKLYPKLYALALRFCRDETDAEDIVHDALARAYRHSDQFAAGSSLKAWLSKIVVNCFYTAVRQRRPAVVDTAELVRLMDAYCAQEPEPELAAGTISDEVAAAINALHAKQRIVLILHDVQDISEREIAEILDCPRGTVMSRLFRAHEHLRVQLKDYVRAQGYEWKKVAA